jgi:hypothetical protein
MNEAPQKLYSLDDILSGKTGEESETHARMGSKTVTAEEQAECKETENVLEGG